MADEELESVDEQVESAEADAESERERDASNITSIDMSAKAPRKGPPA